jgi:ATP-binding cassette, subfamily B, bacterial PglK
MIHRIRTYTDLVGLDERLRWLLVIFLALLVSGFEAVGALLVYVLLGLVSGGEQPLELPAIGSVERLLPAVDETTMMVGAALGVAVFFVARAGLTLGKTYVTVRVLENAGARLSRRLAAGYLAMPYAFHLRRNSSELIRNAYSTAESLVSKVFFPLVKIASEAIVIVGLMAVLVITAPLATVLVVAVVGPTAYLLLAAVNPRLKAIGREQQDLSKASLQSLQQSLGGIRDIKVLGREPFYEEDFGRTRRSLARVRYRHAVLEALPTVGLETVLVVLIAGLFTLTLVAEGSALAAIPVLGLFAYTAFRLKPSVAGIVGAANALRYASAGVDDVSRDLALTARWVPEHPSIGRIPPLPFEHAIQLDGVSFRYEGADRDALTGIELAIRRGESIGIVGPTGGGKTTLVDIILGLLEPSAGAVRVDGVDIRGHTSAWQRNLGMVPQDLFLADDTLRRNIALGLEDHEIDDAQVARAVEMAQLGPVVAALPDGLDTVVGERGTRLSGGQRQRVAIARALYRDPAVVVLDEGTSALDNVTESELRRALEVLRSDRTMISVAHRLSTVRDCDRILFVRDGRIADVGTYDQLLAHGTGFRDFALER